MKNIVLSTSSKKLPLTEKVGKVMYLNSDDRWLIYGRSGQYFRQELPRS
jgi:hypothetical protein